jgi:hypothetical protein
MVQNSEWGPPLWNILHICAEKSGKQSSHMLHIDEIRAWIQVLQLVEAILPCALCQKHYKEWIAKYPIKKFLDIHTPQIFHEVICKWLWKLHDTVNTQRGIEGPGQNEAMLLYKDKGSHELQQDLEKLLEILQRAILLRLVDGAYVREWKRRLALLRTFLHI